MRKLVLAWNRFWFAPVDPFGLALFRVVFGAGMFAVYFVRLLDFGFMFSEKGILSYAQSVKLMPEMYRPVIPWHWVLQNDGVTGALAALLLLGLAGITVGWIGRRGTWLVFILHLCFQNRNWAVVYGPDLVVTFWFFYLCFARTTEHLVWRPYSRRGARPASLVNHPIQDVGTRMSLRFFQLQLCIIYAYSGLEKAKGVPWWQGDALWITFANTQLTTADYSFIHHIPAVLAVLTFATLLWEVYFVCLVWIRPLRKYVLGFGVLLHLGIGVSVGLGFFSYFMIITYLHFLDPSQLKRGWRLVTDRVRPRPRTA
ncbi:MAG: HTTM domain-containing protein [Bacteriovoracia bacterium]